MYSLFMEQFMFISVSSIRQHKICCVFIHTKHIINILLQEGNERPEQTDENQDENKEENEPTEPAVDCTTVKRRKPTFTHCEGTCGIGKRNRTRESYNPNCEPEVVTVDCPLTPCRNKGMIGQ